MKTKDLIKQLQEIDPEGEMDVCINNEDISYIIANPSYYDGRLQKVTKRGDYGVPEETTITTQGWKINLTPLDLSDKYIDSILEDNEEYSIKTEGGCGSEYGWLQAKWLDFKVKNIYWVKLFLENSKSSYYDDISEKNFFIDSLIEKYRQETKNGILSSIGNVGKKANKSITKLVEWISCMNIIKCFGCIRQSSKYYHISFEGMSICKWAIHKRTGKITFYKNEEEVSFDFNDDNKYLIERLLYDYYKTYYLQS